MLLVIGAPIVVPKRSQPSQEELSTHLQAFIDAMEQLFMKHRDHAGYSKTELKIL